MASYNSYANGGSFTNKPLPASSGEGNNIFSKLLRNLSNWGMDYDDMIIRNQVTVGEYEDPTVPATSMYDLFSTRVMANMLAKKSLASLNPSYEQKRKLLREYSIRDEIRDFITDICNEAIVYEQDSTRFCSLTDLSDEYDQQIKDRAQEIFEDVYRALSFNENQNGWSKFKQFIVDGFLAYEIVYDDKGRNIIKIVPVDVVTLTYGTVPINGVLRQAWIQSSNTQNTTASDRKILLDSQIVYISYSNALEWSEVSYVEPLIRPYNLLKTLEKAKMMWQIRNAMTYRKIAIPVDGLSVKAAMQQVGQAISDYQDRIHFDDSSGQVYVDGELNIPFSKEFWFPMGSQTPVIENIENNGPDLQEEKMLQWFRNSLKRASHTPWSRSDIATGGGVVYQNNTDATREELKFTQMINRLRAVFKELIIKPITIQMMLEFPQLKNDKHFQTNLNVIFNANNYFERTKKLAQLKYAAEVDSSIAGLQTPENTPYFHIEYRLRELYGFTDDDLEKNKRWFEKDKANTPSSEAIENEQSPGFGPINPIGEFGGTASTPEAAPTATPEASAETSPEAPSETTEEEPA